MHTGLHGLHFGYNTDGLKRTESITPRQFKALQDKSKAPMLKRTESITPDTFQMLQERAQPKPLARTGSIMPSQFSILVKQGRSKLGTNTPKFGMDEQSHRLTAMLSFLLHTPHTGPHTPIRHEEDLLSSPNHIGLSIGQDTNFDPETLLTRPSSQQNLDTLGAVLPRDIENRIRNILPNHRRPATTPELQMEVDTTYPTPP